MFRLIFSVLILTSISNGQSEFEGKCPSTTSDIDPFNWDDFASPIWYEIYRSDKSHEIDCVQVIYEKMGNRYMLHYSGNLGSEETMWHDYASVTSESSYKLVDRIQTVVSFKKGSYAVVHECVNFGETKRKTYTWILSSENSLSTSDKAEIDLDLKSKGLDTQIKIDDLKETNHPSSCIYQ